MLKFVGSRINTRSRGVSVMDVDNKTAVLIAAPPSLSAIPGETVNIFNPSIIACGDNTYLIAARYISSDLKRCIFIARAGEGFVIDDATVNIVSDRVIFAEGLSVSQHSREWLADPRLFILDERIYLFWNDGMPSSGWNSQFLAEVDPITLSVHPARRVRHRYGQTMHEKNWMLFSDLGAWRAIYSVSPHRVLKLHAETKTEVIFTDGWTTFPDFAEVEASLGHIRGGAQPIHMEDHFLSVAHACKTIDNEMIYTAVAYEFSAHPPL